MTLPKAVLFDWDNTLADTLETCLESTNATLRHFGMDEWDMEKMLSVPHLSLRDSFVNMFKDRAKEAIHVYHEAFAKDHLEQLKTLPYAHDLIRFLYNSGIFMSIISNKTGNFLRSELEFLGWNSYFAFIVGATDYEEDKPSPVPVYGVLGKAGIDPSKDIWFVGDSFIDIQCARNSGCTPVFVGKSLPDNYHGDDIIFAHDCKGLLQILQIGEQKTSSLFL